MDDPAASCLITNAGRNAVFGGGNYVSEVDFEYVKAGAGLVVVFSSYGIEGAPGATAFAQPRFEFMRSLVEHNLSCLFLRDRLQHWYHSGVFGMSSNLPDTARALRDLTQPHLRVMTLGHSMGGYAALLFCAMCDFDLAVATAPQTTILAETRDEWKDRRWAAKIRETHMESVSPEYFDLTETLEKNIKSEYKVFFNPLDRLDRRHAHHIRHVPAVQTSEVSAGGHNTARAIRDSGQLADILACFSRSASLV